MEDVHFLLILPPASLDTPSVFGLELANGLDWIAGKPQGPSPPCLCSIGLQSVAITNSPAHAAFSMWFLGIELRSSCLQGKHFIS